MDDVIPISLERAEILRSLLRTNGALQSAVQLRGGQLKATPEQLAEILSIAVDALGRLEFEESDDQQRMTLLELLRELDLPDRHGMRYAAATLDLEHALNWDAHRLAGGSALARGYLRIGGGSEHAIEVAVRHERRLRSYLEKDYLPLPPIRPPRD